MAMARYKFREKIPNEAYLIDYYGDFKTEKLYYIAITNGSVKTNNSEASIVEAIDPSALDITASNHNEKNVNSIPWSGDGDYTISENYKDQKIEFQLKSQSQANKLKQFGNLSLMIHKIDFSSRENYPFDRLTTLTLSIF